MKLKENFLNMRLATVMRISFDLFCRLDFVLESWLDLGGKTSILKIRRLRLPEPWNTDILLGSGELDHQRAYRESERFRL